MDKKISVSDALSRAVDVLKDNAAFLIIPPIIYWVASQIVGNIGTGGLTTAMMESLPKVIRGEMDPESFSEMVTAMEMAMFVSAGFWLSALLSWVLSVIYNVGYGRFQLQAIDEKELSAGSFKATVGTYLNYFLCTLVVGIATGIATLLCILPGIYLGVRLWLAPYYVIDRDMKALDAIKACWSDMEGNWCKMFLAGLLLVLINIAGYALCCVGLIVTIPLTGVASALLYREVSKK